MIIAESEPVFLRYPVLVEPERKKNTQWAKRDLKLRSGSEVQDPSAPLVKTAEKLSERRPGGCPMH
jgi:hypothetical protein